MFRHAEYKEKDELYSIWRKIFADSQSFASWFFSERFVPYYTAVWEEGGRIACVSHALPVHVRVRGAILPAALIAGVATLPEYRGRGIMRATLAAQMRHLRELGIPLVVHRPENFAIYRSLCHYPVADKAFLTLPSTAPRPMMPSGYVATIIEPESALDVLYSLYSRASQRYGSCMARSFADFALKYRDYAADGVNCAVAYYEGEAICYAFYSQTTPDIECPEVMAKDKMAYDALVAYIASIAEGDVTFALPPDAYAPDGLPAGAKLNVAPRTAGCITDVRAVLRALNKEGLTLEVIDPSVPQNSGVFDISGEPSSAPAKLRLDVGRLAQIAFGYASASGLSEEGLIETESGAAAELDQLLPPQSCYFIDEY